MLWWILGVIVGLVALAALALFLFDLKLKKEARDALAARGNELGTWTVYYDVKAKRIGLISTFGESELLRFLLFRVHDLFDYNQGLEGERRKLAAELTDAAKGQPTTPWQFLFQVPKSETYHSSDSPNATLFKFFDGKLYENAVDQPRFIGGDSIAKQQGLVGECVAIILHLLGNPATAGKVEAAINHLVQRELNAGTAPRGAKFWELPRVALRDAGA